MTSQAKPTGALARALYPVAILGQRNFALVWSSNMLGAMGNQMEALVLGWLVLTMTDSPLYVGLVTAARLGLNPMALFAGAVVDRLPRNLVLVGVEMTAALLGLLMLVLIAGNWLQIWQVFAITLAGGLARIFQMPAVQSLAADAVSEDRIGNGVALTTTGMNFTLIVGPLVGGALFELTGPQGAYAAMVALHLLGACGALLVRVSRSTPPVAGISVLRTVLEGLRYVKGNQPIWAALVVATIINLTGFPFHTTLLPVFARDVLDLGSVGLGLLMSAFGVGAFLGSLALAVTPNLRRAGWLLIGAVAAWHGSIAAFSFVGSTIPALAILVFTGGGVLGVAGVDCHGHAADRPARRPGTDNGPAGAGHFGPHLREHQLRRDCRAAGSAGGGATERGGGGGDVGNSGAGGAETAAELGWSQVDRASGRIENGNWWQHPLTAPPGIPIIGRAQERAPNGRPKVEGVPTNRMRTT